MSSTPVLSAEYQSIESIRNSVQTTLENHLQQRFPSLAVGEDLVVKVGSLDRRLQLLKCASPLTLNINEQLGGANVTVKTQCLTGSRWTIYVPATVETYRDVVVAAHNLARGDSLTEDSVTFQRLNTAKLSNSHIENIDRVTGMEVKRPIRAFEVIKLSQLKKPNLVLKGDTVILRVKSASLTVEAEGTALSNGHKGQQVRVRNEHSRRIVDGLVMGPGEVQVASW